MDCSAAVSDFLHFRCAQAPKKPDPVAVVVVAAEEEEVVVERGQTMEG